MSPRNRLRVRLLTPRPGPRLPGATTGARSAAAVAVRAAVLLMLLTAVLPGGPQAAPAGVAAVGGVSAGPGTGQRADDGYATTCARQAAARHEPRGERTPPPWQPATLADDEATAPSPVVRLPASRSAPAYFCADQASTDRERAPPASAGT